jgi:hypothetical protein
LISNILKQLQSPQTLQSCTMMRFVEVLAQDNLYQQARKNRTQLHPILIGLEAERSVMYNQNKPAREHHDE